MVRWLLISGVKFRCFYPVFICFCPKLGTGGSLSHGCDVDELIGLSDLVCGVDYPKCTINCGDCGDMHARVCACTVHAYVHMITAKCCFIVIF